MGHSMGGLIVQAIAQHYPTEVHKLIIMNSAAVLNSRTKMVLKNLLHFRKSDLSLEDQVDNGLPWFCSNEFLSKPGNISDYLELYKNNPYPQSIADQQRQLDALLAFDASPLLHKIKNPALIINTLEDIIATESDSQTLVDQISHAKLVRLGGAHVLEAIDDTAQALKQFIDT
jgi:pimeloyl-ACP methyl ester carboxylesterase